MYRRIRPIRRTTSQIAQSSTQLSHELQGAIEPSASKDGSVLREHPRVLLMDLDHEAEDALTQAGFRVSTGTFGTPYRFRGFRSFGGGYGAGIRNPYTEIVMNHKIPHGLTENDVVIIDLAPREVLEHEPRGDPWSSQSGEPLQAYWKPDLRLDPRPLAMLSVQDVFRKIGRARGGAFIVFAHPRVPQRVIELREPPDNWSFHGIFVSDSHFHVEPEDGSDIRVSPRGPLTRLLHEHREGTVFSCTLHPAGVLADRWDTLATDSFGAPVAGFLNATPADGVSSDSFVIVLPRVACRAEFLVKLLVDVLPNFSPHLYPDLNLWLHQAPYELPGVVRRQKEIQRIRDEADHAVSALEAELAAERDAYGFLQAMLLGEDEQLKQTVLRALSLIGFEDVRDVDAEMEQRGEHKREDLQVREHGRPILCIDVKGRQGQLSDDDALKVGKHVLAWKRELQTEEVQGLTIVNHERNKPPEERNYRALFRTDLLANAEAQGIGLLTTWDLYQLVLTYLEGNCTHEQISSLLYTKGRIDPAPLLKPPLPAHYEPVGVVEEFWERVGAVGVRLDAAPLHKGDRIAFELADTFAEEDCVSLQVDKVPVNEAPIGALAAIQTGLKKVEATKGTRVFRVRR